MTLILNQRVKKIALPGVGGPHQWVSRGSEENKRKQIKREVLLPDYRADTSAFSCLCTLTKKLALAESRACLLLTGSLGPKAFEFGLGLHHQLFWVFNCGYVDFAASRSCDPIPDHNLIYMHI